MINSESIFVLVPDKLRIPESLRHILTGCEQISCPGGVIFLAKALSGPDTIQLSTELPDSGFVRVFESCWMPQNCSHINETMIPSFFSQIADEYETVISADRNISCYELLYATAIQKQKQSPRRALDFGCGTGLVTATSFANQFSMLMGFDFCPKMANIARNKGLHIIELQAFEQYPQRQFDIVFASYVLHFGVEREQLFGIAQLLDTGGVFVGNVHKSLGLDQLIRDMEVLNVHGYTHCVSASKFGPVIMIQRK